MPLLETFKRNTSFQFACLQGEPGSKHVMTARDKQSLSSGLTLGTKPTAVDMMV